MRPLTATRSLSAIVLASQLLASPVSARETAARIQRPSDQRLWEDPRQLSDGERTDLEHRLTSANQRLGSPLFVLVVGKLKHESAASLAAHTFAARTLGATGSNPILLVLSTRDPAAAIETGKGDAGIVPEIDARRIIKRLVSEQPARTTRQALVQAITAIVESAEATAKRRRPLPIEETALLGLSGPSSDADAGDLPPPSEGLSDGPPSDAGATRVDQPLAPDPKPPAGWSKVPLAAAISGLLLLALALRRRRQVEANRQSTAGPTSTRKPPNAKPPNAKPPNAKPPTR